MDLDLKTKPKDESGEIDRRGASGPTDPAGPVASTVVAARLAVRDWLILLFVLLGVGLSGVLLTKQIAATESGVSQIMSTEAPAVAAAQEMEVNIVELGLETWRYMRTADPAQRIRAELNRQAYRAAQESYFALAANSGDRTQLEALFVSYSHLSESLTRVNDERTASLRGLGEAFASIDNVLDQDIQPALRSAFAADNTFLRTTEALEADVAEVSSAMHAYLLDPTPQCHAATLEAIAESKEHLQVLRDSAEATEITDKLAVIDREFARGVKFLEASIAAHLRFTEDERHFFDLRQKLDEVLDSGVQVAAREQLQLSYQVALRAVDRLHQSGLAVLTLCGAICVGAAGLLTWRAARLRHANGALQRENSLRVQAEVARNQLLSSFLEVQERERQRLARDLHDELGQDLAALNLGLRRMEDRLRAEGGSSPQTAPNKLSALAAGLLTRVQNLAWEMRPAVLDDLGVHGAIERLLSKWSANTGIAADFESSESGRRFPTEIETTLYRIAQEALTNVLKHAHAKHVSATLAARGGFISLVIEDDGHGLSGSAASDPVPGKQALGLRGMRERATLVGGDLTIESSPGQGTTLYVRLPENFSA